MFLSVAMSAAPTPDVIRVREWRAKNERQILAELIQLVSLPNIAANKADIVKNADALTAMFEKRGFAVTRITTPGSPLLVAERVVAEARGHADLLHALRRPADRSEGLDDGPAVRAGGVQGHDTRSMSWQATGPVDPDARIYARAVADDKGPIIAFLAAMDGLLDAKAALPWTLRVVLDGEEEAGSPNFEAAMMANAAGGPRRPCGDRGQPAPSEQPADGVLWQPRPAGAEITIYGATGDLHSGNYGNFVPDPAMALTKLLASMKDDRGNVVIKNFYDGVVPLTASERRAIDEIPEHRSEAARAVRRGAVRNIPTAASSCSTIARR